MANRRPIHAKRLPFSRRFRKKIPQSRIAHARDTLPGFITSECAGTSGGEQGIAFSCPTIREITYPPRSCRTRLIIEVVPNLYLQARQDRLTVVGVDGEFWWSVVTPDGDGCLDNTTAWTVWSLIRYESNEGNTEFSEQQLYNPWDNGIEWPAGSVTDPANAMGMIEGDFSAPRDRISWQRHQLWESSSQCSQDDVGGGLGISDISITGDIPVGDVDGTLVSGSGVISTTIASDAGVNLTGTITDRGGGQQFVIQPKASHMRINSRKRVPLKGNQALVLQVDVGDPFHDCTQTDPPDWKIQFFGHLRPRVELV